MIKMAVACQKLGTKIYVYGHLIIALIPHWKTSLTIATVGGTASFQVVFERGLFQGDALSPILFCLSIAPLSHGLRKMRGFQGRHQTVSHLLFMDNLKIFAESREDLRKATVEGWKVSTALGMQFGLGKCAVAHAKAGRVAAGDALRLQSGATIPNVQYGETYKYLGIAQLFGVNLAKTKEAIRKEYLGRIRKVWSGHTNSKTRVANHNQWCAGVFRYLFAAVHWTRSELVQLDWRTRKVLVQNKCHHSGAAVERLYLPRSEGGRGLQNLLQIWEREVVSTASYLLHSDDPQVQGAVELQEEMGAMGRCSFLDQARQIVEKHRCDIELAETHPKTCSGEVKKHQQEAATTRLLEKTLHRVHAQQTREKGCDRRATVKWLQEGKLQPTTEAQQPRME